MKIQPNDIVKHIPSGETWVVCGVNHDTGKLIPCGYPFPTLANISDCKLVKKGNEHQTEEEIRALLAHGLNSFIESEVQKMTTEEAIKYFKLYLEFCRKNGMGLLSEEPFLIAIAALQEKLHNDELRKQGKLVELPCAVGAPIWKIIRIPDYGEIGDKPESTFRVDQRRFELHLLEEIGKTVFLTREAALVELEKMRDGNYD